MGQVFKRGFCAQPRCGIGSRFQGGEGDFTYNLNGNISAYRNEVTDLGAPVDSLNQPIFTGNVFGSGDFVAITDIGLPIATGVLKRRHLPNRRRGHGGHQPGQRSGG